MTITRGLNESFNPARRHFTSQTSRAKLFAETSSRVRLTAAPPEPDLWQDWFMMDRSDAPPMAALVACPAPLDGRPTHLPRPIRPVVRASRPRADGRCRSPGQGGAPPVIGGAELAPNETRRFAKLIPLRPEKPSRSNAAVFARTCAGHKTPQTGPPGALEPCPPCASRPG